MRLALCILVIASAVASAQPQLSFADRSDTIKAVFERSNLGVNYSSAIAKILSTQRRTEGMKLLDTLIMTTGFTVAERFRLMVLYLHTKKHLNEEYTGAIRDIWVQLPVIPPVEEYELVPYNTALLLACEAFGSDAAWFNGKSTALNKAEATSYLNTWMNETTTMGQQMFDSPTYGTALIVSMQLLYDFAGDPAMRNRAKTMASWLMADFALDYLDGQYAGAHGKENLFSAMMPIASDMSAIGWLYFGNGVPQYRLDQYLACLSKYTLEKEIVELALDRKKPYESFELKRSATRLRGSGAATYPLKKYTYMEPLYAVGSIPAGVHTLSEQHTWDVTWSGDEGTTTVFTMHPYADPGMVAEFVPGSPEEAFKFYSAKDQYFVTATKTVGGSPYESVFHYKNTVIALYDIPDKLPWHPFITGYLPLRPKKLDIDTSGSGWITINTGDVYIALYPLKPYNLYPEQTGMRLYSRGGKTGAIVQAAGRSAVGDYKSFRTKIRKSKIDLSSFETEGIVRYTTIFGDKLVHKYKGTATVNGAAPQFPEGMLFSSPRATSALGSGIMRIEGKKTVLVLDMKNGTSTASPK